jgi:UDP-N-acetylglucosamine 1-carboxyvinyltransferase
MDRFLITGGRRLDGTVKIGGAKNSALKLMAAALLADGPTVLENVPKILDCRTMADVLAHLGAEVTWGDSILTLDTAGADGMEAPYELVRRMRASIIVLGPLLARHGRGRVAMPGGCNIGSRQIDLHLKGLERMGVAFAYEHGFLEATAPSGLHGATIWLDFPSVGATENVLMAAVSAQGSTVIENAAREPEIQDLAHLLAEMGAKIQGAGTTTIEIEGTPGPFAAVRHRVVPDRIEAGTYAIAVCAAGGKVFLESARTEHLEMPLDKLADAGATIRADEGGLHVEMAERARSVDFVTLPYPGFPTDLQPQMMSLLAAARGTSIATENVFESRFMFVDELNRMGADIRTEGHHAVIRGVERLSAAPVRALDIRAGAAMVVAGLAADGTTEISDVYHIDRGYEDLEGRLASLGADIRREPSEWPALG